MNEINNRVAEVIKDSKLTKTAFAAKLNISQPTVSQICSGLCGVSDRVISDICRVFNVSETWLRTGEGEMHMPRPREEVIAEMVGSALSGSNEFKRAVVQMICSRTDSELETLEAAIRAIFDNL